VWCKGILDIAISINDGNSGAAMPRESKAAATSCLLFPSKDEFNVSLFGGVLPNVEYFGTDGVDDCHL